MDWIQTMSIIVTVIGCAYYIHRDISEDMKTQCARTDRLYEMDKDLFIKLDPCEPVEFTYIEKKDGEFVAVIFMEYLTKAECMKMFPDKFKENKNETL